MFMNEITKSRIDPRSVLRKSRIGKGFIGNHQIIPSKSLIGQQVNGNIQIRSLWSNQREKGVNSMTSYKPDTVRKKKSVVSSK